MPTPASSSLDRFVSTRAALALAFAWGFAEATFFFLVPDVLLTTLACRSLRPALKGSLAALAGALIGGAVMYGIGARAPGAARGFLDHVPAINATLIATVESEVDNRGLGAVMIGPLRGIPYKVYAVEWGARRGGLIAFLLISVPARVIRFVLAAVAARGIARAIKPWTRARARIELLLLTAFWVVFYSFYFAHFGW